MKKHDEIDHLDRKILSILMSNAKIPYTDIAKELGVSGGTVHVRMRKLEQMGIVVESNLKVDYAKLGFDVAAFIGIYLDKSSRYKEVITQLQTIPEIVGAHYTTGNYAIFAKLICRDTNHLRDVLSEKVQSIGGIQRTETFISLEESINRPIDIMSIPE
ncbi:MAG: Lrp/AsnC ligand binding domain-containing protein [Saprospiraceae bacterium]|nr:Lrp/AsnC ligand binding domain-containing protein [Saprospiraceae bacterium]